MSTRFETVPAGYYCDRCNERTAVVDRDGVLLCRTCDEPPVDFFECIGATGMLLVPAASSVVVMLALYAFVSAWL